MSEYSIREISQMYNVSLPTIRYYEDIGLLSEVEHINNRRVYNDSHINRMNAISCFKQTGLSLTDMLDFFESEKNLTGNIDHIVDLMETHEREIVEEIQKLQEGLKHINHKVRFYNGIRDAINANQPFPLWEDYNE